MAVRPNPLQRARAATTERQAARIYQELEAELALLSDDELPPGWASEAERALDELRGRYRGTDLGDASVAAGPKGEPWMPSSSKSAKAKLSGLDPDEAAAAGREAGGGPTRPSGSGQRATNTGAGRRRSTGRRSATPRRGRGRGRGFTDRSFEQTGVPGAARSTGRFALEVLGLTIGLSLTYLLLTDASRAARGRSAVESIGNGVSALTALIIRPVDPLGSRQPVTRAANPGGGTTRPTTAASLAAGSLVAERIARRPSHLTRPPLAPSSGGRRPT